MRKNLLLVLWVIIVTALAAFAQTARRPLKLDDLARFRNVGDPQISPDGKWFAYTVATIDAKEDKSNTHIWLVNYDGTNDRQITFSNDSENSPRWSPDGKYLSFTSSRSSGKPGVRGSQVWLLDRAGGEAIQLTELKGRLQGYEWSPDSKRLALVIGDPDPEDVDIDEGITFLRFNKENNTCYATWLPRSGDKRIFNIIERPDPENGEGLGGAEYRKCMNDNADKSWIEANAHCMGQWLL